MWETKPKIVDLCLIIYMYIASTFTSWMLRIDGERKRLGQLRLRVARGQPRGPNCFVGYIYMESPRQLYH